MFFFFRTPAATTTTGTISVQTSGKWWLDELITKSTKLQSLRTLFFNFSPICKVLIKYWEKYFSQKSKEMFISSILSNQDDFCIDFDWYVSWFYSWLNDCPGPHIIKPVNCVECCDQESGLSLSITGVAKQDVSL